ncbi:MAG TPA: immunoglobulin domain-containing protein, partial [Candidatus Acidoferrum sp.]|nr:immunoglobulin domain-containing protein [Candidatus Acidoferrum sp.]
FYEYQFNPTPGVFPSFALDSAHGDAVYLSAADSGGNLYGFRTDVKFGAAENGVSFGRYTNSTGVEFVAMSQHTFGIDNPVSLAQFRTGTGLPNAYPKVGPVVMSEIMYYPVTVSSTNLVENPDEEFVELYNLSTTNVPLYLPASPANTWQLKGGINFSFPTGASMPAQNYALVVHFDPIANPSALSAFRARFSLNTNTPVFGPFTGRLADEGDTVELYKPDTPSPPPDAGFVPFILVDRVSYLPTAPWSAAAAGGGASLQRRIMSDFGDDPLNWKAEPPTAGGTNIATGVVPPIITRQPQNSSVPVGNVATLSVSAAGTAPLTYRWQRNGINVQGGTGAVLSVYNAQPINSSSYRVWVSNAAGSICSQPATLTVLQAPVITAQPLGMTASEGGNATLQVKASGTSPLSYQWYLNNSPVAGATISSLALDPVDPSQAGIYQVLVTNSVGMVASAPAVLKVIGLDSDGDGIPDSWMLQYFGHPTGLASDHSRAQDDADGDGMTNLQEYLAGTNPLDPQSSLKLRAQPVNPATGRPQFAFTAVAGVGYTLLYSDNLASRIWTKLRDYAADPTTRTVVVNDPGAANSPARFYRLVTPMQSSSNADSDGDGIPDWWMLQHFGHPTGLASDNSRAQDDADGDGMTNLQEYLAGTDPLDPQSVLKLYVLDTDPVTGRPQFEFTAIAGIGYTLLYSDSLTPPVWRKLVDVPVDVNTRAFLVDDPASAGVPMRFYRVVTPVQSFWDPDSDGDGIPDSWMLQIFGHPTGLASDHSRAQDDADGDGMTNLQEYRAGTDPLDPQSNLKLQFQGMDSTTGLPQVSFTAMPGIGYTLQYSDDLTSGNWQKLRDEPAADSIRTVILTDPKATNSSTRFYRIVTPIQP